ncbi:MAG: hypothetical protein PVJ67_06065 [Candidatus Pacearchaeota archaeon]|jgi:hypothetical protein
MAKTLNDKLEGIKKSLEELEREKYMEFFEKEYSDYISELTEIGNRYIKEGDFKNLKRISLGIEKIINKHQKGTKKKTKSSFRKDPKKAGETRGDYNNLPNGIMQRIVSGEYYFKQMFQDVYLEKRADLEDIRDCFIQHGIGQSFRGMMKGYKNMVKQRKEIEKQSPLAKTSVFVDKKSVVFQNRKGAVSSNRGEK